MLLGPSRLEHGEAAAGARPAPHAGRAERECRRRRRHDLQFKRRASATGGQTTHRARRGDTDAGGAGG